MNQRKRAMWTVIGVAAALMAVALGVGLHRWSVGAMRIKGAVIRRDVDTRKELPIAGVDVTVSNGVTSATTQSEASGYFNIPFPRSIWPGEVMVLSFRHPGYQPLSIKIQGGLAAGKLNIAAMEPIPSPDESDSNHAALAVTNIRIRYTTNSQTRVNIGSAVKTFQVANTGNLPCDHKALCSPDGRWKASIASESMDAGVGNEFSNVRASCIAGPCPFTKIDSNGFASGGRTITVSALNWSDTATFLLEAEVFHDASVSNERELYPVVFGRALNFTLPPTQEGVSIEVEINGEPMVFPLGPALYLSWATCTARTNSDPEKTTVYRCELKPGYRF